MECTTSISILPLPHEQCSSIQDRTIELNHYHLEYSFSFYGEVESHYDMHQQKLPMKKRQGDKVKARRAIDIRNESWSDHLFFCKPIV